MFGGFIFLFYICTCKPTIRWSGFYLWMWDANRSMTQLYRVLATDAYLKAEQTIKAEQTNVARMTARYLANTDDANLLVLLKETLADYLEVESETLEVVPYYQSDDQWGVQAKYTDEYDDHCIDICVEKIYDFAWNLCDF